MNQPYFLRMTVWGPKHVVVIYSVNKVVLIVYVGTRRSLFEIMILVRSCEQDKY